MPWIRLFHIWRITLLSRQKSMRTKMPLIRKPTTQELEDHFFGSGAFQYGWFDIEQVGDVPLGHFPVNVTEWDNYKFVRGKTITEDMFVEGIKQYAESLPDRSFDDLIEDM